MNNKELLNKYTVLCMQLQEEYLKAKQDFKYQETLNKEFISLKQEIMKRMENNKSAKKENKIEWVNHNACRFCKGSRFHSCLGHDCRDAVEIAGQNWDKWNVKQEMPSKSLDERDQEIRALQAVLDYRSGVEVQAIKLITECKFKEAMELLENLR